MTSSVFLTSFSRPSGTSVVTRGLTVNAKLACEVNPPFPEGDPNIIDAIESQVGWSEKEKADFRTQMPLCAGCHDQFDAYGLALDGFDALGRARSQDLEGRPIDTAATLPELFEHVAVSGAAEMAPVIAESRVFKACMAMSFMNFAFADITQGSASAPLPNPQSNSCAVKDVVQAAEDAGDPSFTRLLVEITRSPAFRLRRVTP